jgi:NAD(P)-dependent dehydrogenase (short-subunit alcohol dehydrogenase family)
MKLKDRVALVTGASRGIGEGIARRYAEEGAKVALVSRNLEAVQSLAAEIRAKGGQALPWKADVTRVKDVEEMIAAALGHFGKLDILVNNAGIGMAHPSETLSPEDWRRTMDTNLDAVFYCSQAAARQWIARKEGGKILNIASGYGIVAAPLRAAYCASKAGCIMLTKALAVEWAKYGINVNALAPGYTRTELVQEIVNRGVLDEGAIKRRTPLGRFAEIEDLTGMAVLLVSDEGKFITGETVAIDGGWTAYGYL